MSEINYINHSGNSTRLFCIGSHSHFFYEWREGVQKIKNQENKLENK